MAVGPLGTNSYTVRATASPGRGVIVDPGEEPERLLAQAAQLSLTLEAILVTHTHFDHIGAVAALATATGAPVYCPAGERPVLVDPMRFTPPGFGPFEGHEPEHVLEGGEHLHLAGLCIDVLATPGHSPAHLTYAISPAGPARGDAPERTGASGDAAGEAVVSAETGGEPPALFSGDVLFQGSVGRVDLPGGDWGVLERSIASMIERFPLDSPVYPGHMDPTTLRRELAANPFLADLARDLVARSSDPSSSAAPGAPAGTTPSQTPT
ncbi:MAG: MBL fold metallo-hydrolase [Acidobacteriota bacterium]|nr:MBL fold metallo-hydrolase [Acidobacteriota bacterium]